MKEKELNVLSKTIKLCSGEEKRADVFDIMYETGLPYPELKSVLDKLVEQKELVVVDIKTYAFTGDPEKRLGELCGGSQGEKKTAKKSKKPQKTSDCTEEEMRRRRELIERLRRIDDEVDAEEEDEYYEDDDEFNEEEDKRYEEYLNALSDELDDEPCVDADGEDFEDDKQDNGEEDGDGETEEPLPHLSLFNDPYYKEHKQNFDSRARHIMTYAFILARTNNCTYVASEHLVCSMLTFYCKGGEVLKNCGMDPKAFKEYFLKCLDGTCGVRGFTPKTKRILYNAKRLAVASGNDDTLVNTLHLLLSLLTESECLAVKILTVLGGDINKITQAAKDALFADDE